jgi:hypothetical protein
MAAPEPSTFCSRAKLARYAGPTGVLLALCMDEAPDASRMARAGQSVAEIRAYIDKKCGP